MKNPARTLALLSVAALAAGLGSTAGAYAAPTAGDHQVLVRDLAGPLSTAVAADGTVYVTANNAGQLWMVPEGGGDPSLVYEAEGEVGAVSVDGPRVVFVVNTETTRKIYQITGNSDPKVLANVGRYEKQNNPDKGRTYGFLGLSKACKAKLPEQIPSAYPGIVDSHPYATEQVGSTVYVADAGGNDILSISSSGEVSKLAVLPRTKVKATKARVKTLGLPVCVTGHNFALEPVPTDVEVGPDGWLYVSSLPGGPEDGSLGAQGRVYKVNPANGKVVEVARGFLSSVNVAVADTGDVYVAQLFGGSIVRIPAGTSKVKQFAEVPMPAGLEWTEDGLFATIDALKGNKSPKGKLAFIPFA